MGSPLGGGRWSWELGTAEVWVEIDGGENDEDGESNPSMQRWHGPLARIKK